MPARLPRDAPALARLPLAAAATGSSCRAARRSAFEHRANMLHFHGTRGHVENEGAVADVDITRHFVRDPIVTAYQKRADGLVILERHQPVRILFSCPCIPEF